MYRYISKNISNSVKIQSIIHCLSTDSWHENKQTFEGFHPGTPDLAKQVVQSVRWTTPWSGGKPSTICLFYRAAFPRSQNLADHRSYSTNSAAPFWGWSPFFFALTHRRCICQRFSFAERSLHVFMDLAHNFRSKKARSAINMSNANMQSITRTCEHNVTILF